MTDTATTTAITARRKRKWDLDDKGNDLAALAASSAQTTLTNATGVTEAKAAAQQLNQVLAARGVIVTPSAPLVAAKTQLKKISEHVAEIEINDCANRHILTRSNVQEFLKKETKTSMITRGRYYPDRSKIEPNAERPLYLRISASDADTLDAAVQRIKSVMEYNGVPPEIVHLIPSSFALARMYFPFEGDPSEIKTRIMGPDGFYLKHIESETGAKVALRGRGSGFVEGSLGKESDERMHLLITGESTAIVNSAKPICENLISTVQADMAFQRPPPPPPPSFSPVPYTYSPYVTPPGYSPSAGTYSAVPPPPPFGVASVPIPPVPFPYPPQQYTYGYGMPPYGFTPLTQQPPTDASKPPDSGQSTAEQAPSVAPSTQPQTQQYPYSGYPFFFPYPTAAYVPPLENGYTVPPPPQLASSVEPSQAEEPEKQEAPQELKKEEETKRRRFQEKIPAVASRSSKEELDSLLMPPPLFPSGVKKGVSSTELSSSPLSSSSSSSSNQTKATPKHNPYLAHLEPNASPLVAYSVDEDDDDHSNQDDDDDDDHRVGYSKYSSSVNNSYRSSLPLLPKTQSVTKPTKPFWAV